MDGHRALDRRQALALMGGVGVTTLAACSTGSEPPAPVHSSSSLPTAVASTSPSTAAPSTSPARTLDSLSSQLSSPLLRPGTGAYGQAATLYNPRFDATARPAAIAPCHTAADVAACVRYAASGGAQLRLRAGGHSYGGWSTGTGLVADVTAMSDIAIDTAARTAKIGAGARLIDVYSALGAKGLAIAAGSCPTVGLTGLTLGGGVGVLARAYGLTCDALTAAEVVTADAQLREVSAATDGDLFWALRGGGGGSFGAVTSLTLKLHPAPTVHTFYLAWDLEHSQSVLTAWQTWIAAADDDLWSTCKVLTGAASAQQSVSVSGTWIGTASALDTQLAPLLKNVESQPSSRSISTLTYQQAMFFEAGCSGQSADQCRVEALQPTKRQPFAATSAIVTQPLPAAGITAAVHSVMAGAGLSGLIQGGVSFDALGGAVAAVGVADTAFVHRSALASLQFTATYSDAAADPGPYDAYVRAQRQALQPFTGTGAYVNYADSGITDYATAYWGSNYSRLQAVKKSYDPGNIFTFPQAVQLP